ncbi:MAG: 5-formyltetrahydrofolate cyclo-ligase [Undibacterium sp.]|nr:5-formyltetrahydrofolate cyclo-ligase [Undibacterium sp.]
MKRSSSLLIAAFGLGFGFELGLAIAVVASAIVPALLGKYGKAANIATLKANIFFTIRARTDIADIWCDFVSNIFKQILINPLNSMTQPTHHIKEHSEQTQEKAQTRPALRQELLQLRRSTALALRQEWDAQIRHKLMAKLDTLSIGYLAVYWPIKAEPDLRACYQTLHERGVKLALPLVVAKDQALQFVPWAPGDAMDTDDFGIPIPQKRDQFVTPDVILIPCVGYNENRFRLGYGGGFYDRSLAVLPQAQTIGVAYSQASTPFAPEVFDIALQVIITE